VWKQAKAECGSRTEALQKIEIPWNPLAAVNHKNKRNAAGNCEKVAQPWPIRN